MQTSIKLASGYETVVRDRDTVTDKGTCLDSVTIFQKDTEVPLAKVYIADGRITVRWNETVIKAQLKLGDNILELNFKP